MNYVLDLFTPETWKAFREHGCDVTGFAKAHRSRAKNVKVGDIFICYLVRLSRWCGVLEVISEMYEDSSPIFQKDSDPWTIRFKVKPLVILDELHAVPIRLPEVWNGFSRTQHLKIDSPSWAGKAALQSSLTSISSSDGKFLSQKLEAQKTSQTEHPLTERDQKALQLSFGTVKTSVGTITVFVPGEGDSIAEALEELPNEDELRESHQKQALLAEIGAQMGFQIWIPKGDRTKIVKDLTSEVQKKLLNDLPLNYDESTFRTIAHIDVLWLKQRRIVRAFEVEHTTAIYSGILRMADLLALQPNIDIRLHIVAPEYRREKVLSEIRRPVFSVLEKGPLAQNCSFLSYEAVDALSEQEHLAHMNDSILKEFEEVASE
jgi:EVE domain